MLWDMSRHDGDAAHAHAAQVDNMQVLHVEAWDTTGGSTVAVWAAYLVDGEIQKRSLGSRHLPYQLLSLPSLGQVLWTLGDEIRASYRDLTPPQ